MEDNFSRSLNKVQKKNPTITENYQKEALKIILKRIYQVVKDLDSKESLRMGFK